MKWPYEAFELAVFDLLQQLRPARTALENVLNRKIVHEKRYMWVLGKSLQLSEKYGRFSPEDFHPEVRGQVRRIVAMKSGVDIWRDPITRALGRIQANVTDKEA